MHGKLVQEAKKETVGFWGEERKRRSILSSQFDGGVFALVFWRAAWRVADFFRCTNVLLSCCVMS
jgi:hypothetical protein